MLVKDTSTGNTQKLESFTAQYVPDNEAYAAPPLVADFPYLRTLVGSDVNKLSIINGYEFTSTLTGQRTSGCSMATQGTLTSAIAPTASVPMALTFATSTTATTTAGFADQSQPRVLANMKSIKFSLRFQQTTNMRIWMGVSSSTANTTFRSDTPNAQFVGFRYSTAAGDTNLICVTQTSNVSSTKNAASPSLTPDTNAHIFEIQYDGTNAVFFIDGTQVGSQSGNIPTNTTLLSILCFIDNVGLANSQKFDLYSLSGVDYPTG